MDDAVDTDTDLDTDNIMAAWFAAREEDTDSDLYTDLDAHLDTDFDTKLDSDNRMTALFTAREEDTDTDFDTDLESDSIMSAWFTAREEDTDSDLDTDLKSDMRMAALFTAQEEETETDLDTDLGSDLYSDNRMATLFTSREKDTDTDLDTDLDTDVDSDIRLAALFTSREKDTDTDLDTDVDSDIRLAALFTPREKDTETDLDMDLETDKRMKTLFTARDEATDTEGLDTDLDRELYTDNMMAAWFTAREEELQRLKRKIEVDGRNQTGMKTNLLRVLKHEMVELMERDVSLWHQLVTLNKAVAAVKHDLIENSSRINTFPCLTGSDLGLFKAENEDKEEIRTKPRAHTVTSGDGLREFTKEQLLGPESQTVRTTKDFHAVTDTDIADVERSMAMSNRKNGFFGMFNFKSELFESSISHFRNNVFLSGLNSGFMDLVGDLIKPSSSQHILPRRKLHRQANVIESFDVQIDDGHNVNILSGENESILRKLDLEECQFESNFKLDAKDAEIILSDTINKNRSGVNVENKSDFGVSRQEVKLPERDIQNTGSKENNTNNDEFASELIEDTGEPELDEMSFTYLTLKDGCVSCRIMSPGLEQQIKLKRETEEEVLEYLKCKNGFARFRSGSDSDSSSSSNSGRSDNDTARVNDEYDDEKYCEIYVDIRRLFRTNEMEDVSSVSDDESEEELVLSPLTYNTYELQYNTKVPIDRFEDISPLEEEQVAIMCEYENNPLDVKDSINAVEGYLDYLTGDTQSVVSQRFIDTGFAVSVNTDKHCNLSYRISSVDSGIGDENIDSFDMPD